MRIPKYALSLAVVCALTRAADVTQTDNKLWEYRNLGKAFYENPDTHLQAVDALHSALELAPNSVEERVNYGLALLRAGRNDEAVKELTEAQKQDPSLPYTWFNLGIHYKHAGDYDKAIEQLQGMIRLRPDEPIPHYNLASVLRSKGDLAAALPEFLQAEKLNPNLAGPHFQLFSLYQRMGKREEAAAERQQFEAAKKRDEGAAVPEDMEWCFYAELYDPPDPRPYPASEPTKYEDRKIASGVDGIAVVDSEASGHADLITWSAKGVILYKRGTQAAAGVGLDGLSGVRTIAVGDYDNDGFADLAVLTPAGVTLFHNDHGKFSKAAELPNTAGASALLWLDYDHDYDLDLFALGENPVLMRNVGAGKFEEHSAGFPFVKGKALDAAAFAVRGDTAARDFVVTYADRPATLYHDRLNEKFETEELPGLAAGSAGLSVQDINHDGFLDLVSYKPSLHAVQNDDGVKFVEVKEPKAAPSSMLADFNGDFREDYADIAADASLHLFMNASASQHWSTVRIGGIKNLKLAPGATVEVKTGIFYDKRIYAGIPIAFALDGHSDFDTVRITWPNGLIQNEIHQKSNAALTIAEAQRLSGSCPMIFTWNGKEFQFITDVLGVAPLGASSGDGSYFPVDHDEYIQIPGSALQPVNGKYQVHITEELHEVSYLDKVQLIAVDHPADVNIYTNDKFKSPPYPEFRLFGSKIKIHPVRATEGNGADATARVARQDHTYPDTFSHNDSGVAEMHTLDLDFGDVAKTNHAALVLNGWVDWADGSTFLGASQNGKGLTFPYIQVKDAAGQWQTVVQDMGIPSGKPKTMVVDLTGKFLSKSRQVRIMTNLCVYWDEVFLIEDAATPAAELTKIEATAANLNFRGFSKVVVDPNRQQPEEFVYGDVHAVSNWNPTRGNYTRYGDVTPLVNTIDDKLIVMGSGDELKLTFPAAQLPTLREGWTRDFLLLVDGWAKDSDANTAFSQSVLPLPFHGMSSYPYKSNEHFPDDSDHTQYIKDYLTRPALQLIRPLD